MEQHPDSPGSGRAPSPSLPDFAPVRLRWRRDGWTPARQRAFIAALAESGCVLEACRRVGKSPEAAYRLGRRPDAAGFRAAWHAALAASRPRPVNFRTPMAGVKVVKPSTSGPSTSGDAPAVRPAYSLDALVRAARRAGLSSR